MLKYALSLSEVPVGEKIAISIGHSIQLFIASCKALHCLRRQRDVLAMPVRTLALTWGAFWLAREPRAYRFVAVGEYVRWVAARIGYQPNMPLSFSEAVWFASGPATNTTGVSAPFVSAGNRNYTIYC